MIRTTLFRRAGLMLFALLFVLAPAFSQEPDEVAKVEQAMPAEAKVKPAAPRKILVFNLCQGFKHSAVGIGAKAIELMGQKTGAYETVMTEDIAMFEPDTLKQFDAVVMNNATGALFTAPDLDKLPPDQQAAAKDREARLKQSLLDFVKGGKGIIGVHAATDAFYEWADYGDMMGGYFDGHPWNADTIEMIRVDDPSHPLTAAFQGMSFKVQDEIYQFRDPYSRANLRVLLTLDPDGTDLAKAGVKRTDGDFAVAWIRAYGQGRVFYCSLGHNHDIFWTPAILQHYLDGIQYALGDLPADTTPSAQLPANYREDAMKQLLPQALNNLAAGVKAFTYGGDESALRAMQDIVVKAQVDPALREAVEPVLIGLLAEGTPPFARDYACRQLYLVGGPASVPALAALLPDVACNPQARYALERMECPEASDALRAALDTLKGGQLTGVINSLGEKRDRKSQARLAELLADENAAVSEAAARALGSISGYRAEAALLRYRLTCAPEQRPVADLALLDCAARFISDDLHKREALMICDMLFAPDMAPATRAAAFTQHIVLLDEAQWTAAVIEGLKDPEVMVRQAAASQFQTCPELAPALGDDVFALPLDAQTLVFQGIAAARTPGCTDLVLNGLRSQNVSVREAALAAAAVLGGDELGRTVLRLAKNDVITSEAAADALTRMPFINGLLLEQLRKADPEQVMLLADTAAARRIEEAMPVLAPLLSSDDAAVRASAWSALAVLTDPLYVSELLKAAITTNALVEGSGAEDALAAVLAKAGAEKAGPLLADVVTHNPTLAPEPMQAILRLAGGVPSPATLTLLTNAVALPSDALAETAIRGLAAWPTSEPLDALIGAAETGRTTTAKVLALRGAIAMLGKPMARSEADRLACLEKCFTLADTLENKTAVIAVLGDVADQRVFEVLGAIAADPELAQAANTAIEKAKNRPVKAFASSGEDAVGKALDGDPATRWTSGAPQAGGEWFMLDFGWEKTVQKITLDTAESAGDGPAAYAIYAGNNPENLGEPVITGENAGAVQEIAVPDVLCRYVKIAQTGSKAGSFWSIHEIKVEMK